MCWPIPPENARRKEGCVACVSLSLCYAVVLKKHRVTRCSSVTTVTHSQAKLIIMSANKKTAKSSMDNFVVKHRRTTSAPPTPSELHDELNFVNPGKDSAGHPCQCIQVRTRLFTRGFDSYTQTSAPRGRHFGRSRYHHSKYWIFGCRWLLECLDTYFFDNR